ncbi:ABC transporter permease subunit [Enterococcus sp. AZ103]|uniref:ABC transporter permease subunit n=1 Tax=Enterococcus sp. AZ103 TaxID=2774628 RepID=UPI003F1ECC59
MKRNSVASQLLPWLIPLIIIILWQIASSLNWISSNVLPAPLAVVSAGVELFESGELMTNLTISLYRATVGFVIGGGIGFILGLLTGLSKTCRLLLDSTIQMIRNIPHLALIPLVIAWFGIDEVSKIFLVAIGVMFPVYVNTLHGIIGVDSDLIEMGKIYQLSKWQLYTNIIFPSALPSILVGIRYALGVMWTTLIVAETIASDSGIGYMAMNAREFMQMDVIVLSILLYAILGKISDLIAKYFEDITLAWRDL